jgi:protein-disulfide isomerase
MVPGKLTQLSGVKDRIMFKIKKENRSLIIFVAISVMAFLVFGVLVIILSVRMGGNIETVNANSDKYYLNDDFKNDDPYVTKNPTLKDILKGPIISQNDPWLGNEEAPVTIVYFSDFTCKFCHSEEQIFKKIISEYKTKVRVIWKDYPEAYKDSISYKSAIAGRCALTQGKFWQFHDLLFAVAEEIKEEDLYKIASELDIDNKEFKKCYTEQETAHSVDENMEEADALGIVGIPDIYVNDKEVMGEVGYEELRGMVEVELGNTR